MHLQPAAALRILPAPGLATQHCPVDRACPHLGGPHAAEPLELRPEERGIAAAARHAIAVALQDDKRPEQQTGFGAGVPPRTAQRTRRCAWDGLAGGLAASCTAGSRCRVPHHSPQNSTLRSRLQLPFDLPMPRGSASPHRATGRCAGAPPPRSAAPCCGPALRSRTAGPAAAPTAPSCQ